MTTAIFTGSFNPFTAGHENIIRRAAAIFDKLYVVVMINPEKSQKIFIEERADIIRQKIKDIDNVVAASYNGFAVDFAKSVNADYIIRGLRNSRDYVYEQEMSAYNLLHGGINTLYLLADDNLKTVCSSKITDGLNIK